MSESLHNELLRVSDEMQRDGSDTLGAQQLMVRAARRLAELEGLAVRLEAALSNASTRLSSEACALRQAATEANYTTDPRST